MENSFRMEDRTHPAGLYLGSIKTQVPTHLKVLSLGCDLSVTYLTVLIVHCFTGRPHPGSRCPPRDWNAARRGPAPVLFMASL